MVSAVMMRSILTTTVLGLGLSYGYPHWFGAGAIASVPPPDFVAQAATPDVEGLLDLINQARSQAGLPPLTLNEQLTAAAQAHAQAMAVDNFFSQTDQTGLYTDERVVNFGYGGRVGENIAAGRANIRWVLEKWLDSPGYRMNLLDPEFTDVGLGYGFNRTSDFNHYWSIVLGAGRDSTPNVPLRSQAVAPDPDGSVLTVINTVRQQACVPTLRLNAALTTVAQDYVGDVAATGTTDWQGMPADLLDTQLAQQASYEAMNVVQLIGQQAQAPDLVAAWQRDQVNREALLRPEYVDVGIGYAVQGDQGASRYWTAILAEPRYPAPLDLTIDPLRREAGSLDDTDATLPADGSVYDIYSFTGQAGQRVAIDLESEAFDTYLFLFNPRDAQIADNDDRSDRSSNSRIVVDLPCNGTYRVMVNSYNANSRGRYTLSIYELGL
ncbi:CAP domain-containing protein [Spirulina major]|uniref:CAP domain-containing protein n=1 Tax=Spirulina major TaxID=270636 RepID=UPI0009332E5D|nr:CAP domain-containing protein [Spirulina major]